MNLLKISASAVLLSFTLTAMSASASTVPQQVGNSGATTKMASDFIPVSGNVNYSFNSKEFSKINDSKFKAIYKVECSKNVILNSLGITQTGTFSVGLEKGTMDWNYDIRNCSLYGNPRNFDYSSQGTLKKADALIIAEKFVNENIKNNVALYTRFGAPIVASHNYGPIMYKDAAASAVVPESNDIEIDESDVTDIEKEYSSYTVTYPFVVSGMNVYGNYGNKLGVTLEVNKNGITSVSVPLLKFKLVKKNSVLMSAEEIKNFVLKGANAPYYGNQGTTVDFKKIENVLVVTDIYSNGKNDKLLSTGTAFISDVDRNNGTNEKYVQVISDYKVGNNSVY